jgi:hypothetical protein
VVLVSGPAVDQAELRAVAGLVARLTPTQQRVAIAVANGFRAGWLAPEEWERYWRDCDFGNDAVLRDVMTWLVRRGAQTPEAGPVLDPI